MKAFCVFQSNSFDMSNERQPLLLGSDTEQAAPPRPDVRNSPENVIVDGSDDFKSPDDGNKALNFNIITLSHKFSVFFNHILIRL